MRAAKLGEREKCIGVIWSQVLSSSLSGVRGSCGGDWRLENMVRGLLFAFSGAKRWYARVCQAYLKTVISASSFFHIT